MRQRLRGSIALGAVVLTAVAVAVTGCGSSSGGGGGENGKPATLKVGVIPIADVAPLYLGIKKGFFKQEKLTIKPQQAPGGAAIVAATVSGENQIGFSNTTSLLIANSKNLPVKLIAQGVAGAASPTRRGVGRGARQEGQLDQVAQGPRGQDRWRSTRCRTWAR